MMHQRSSSPRNLKTRGLLALAAFLIVGPGPASALPFVLDFEGLQDLEFIDQYYNGGLGSLGSGPGPDYGVTFVNSESLISIGAGGNGNFGNNPSGFTVAFLFINDDEIMNVAGGFSTGLAFFYAAAVGGSVDIFSGPNGTGAVLAHVDLPPTPTGDFPETYNTWVPVGIPFQGTALSVSLNGAANFIGFDDLTIGSASPLTVPDNAGLTVNMLAALALFLPVMLRCRPKAGLAQVLPGIYS